MVKPVVLKLLSDRVFGLWIAGALLHTWLLWMWILSPHPPLGNDWFLIIGPTWVAVLVGIGLRIMTAYEGVKEGQLKEQTVRVRNPEEE